MSERGFHRIEDDIAETWLEDWAGAGLAELEAYLAKHADFLRFVDAIAAASRLHDLRPSSLARSAFAKPSWLSSMPFGIAPTAEALGAPPSKSIMFGIDWIP